MYQVWSFDLNARWVSNPPPPVIDCEVTTESEAQQIVETLQDHETAAWYTKKD